ncbi:HpcH/HpaI aldolase/citrate lyase family protein [Natrinema caseinilyticum]|uniref:HpcH/HpaI aldolase/citrate lyase family protein n=1 Tax=Natrinema caseinilyticum TaxID=2961570 RepID=UPI0020C23B22|nr:CoA ester lyase [Natrinema caseinilyticum]
MELRGSYHIVPGLRESALDDPVKSIEDATKANSSVTVIDLEDGVGPALKDVARDTTVQAIEEWGDLEKEIVIRINALNTPHSFKDLEAIRTASVSPRALLVPDIQSASDLQYIEKYLQATDQPMGIIPLIERPSAIFNLFEIAHASQRIEAIVFGSVDFRRYMGMPTMEQNPDIDLPRYVTSMAASAAGVPAIDTVYLHRSNLDGLRSQAENARAIGFDGKLATSVEQVPVIEETFAPTEEEIAYAERIVQAFEKAGDETGLITVDGTTVDIPIIREQRALLKRAKKDKTHDGE